MRKILVIAQKELATYFKTPLAYIILFITLSTFNTFFFMIIDQNREASLRDMFKLMEFMFVFIIPLLTMKIFAEEKRMGTMEFLLTSPVTIRQLILGKYLGSLTFFSIIILLTKSYIVILRLFSPIDILAAEIGFVGVWLEGALFIAIGTFFSSLTKNQIIAAISTYALLFLFYFSVSFIKYADPSLQPLIRALSFWGHMENFGNGLIAISSITYFLSGLVFFIGLTHLCLINHDR